MCKLTSLLSGASLRTTKLWHGASKRRYVVTTGTIPDIQMNAALASAPTHRELVQNCCTESLRCKCINYHQQTFVNEYKARKDRPTANYGFKSPTERRMGRGLCSRFLPSSRFGIVMETDTFLLSRSLGSGFPSFFTSCVKCLGWGFHFNF